MLHALIAIDGAVAVLAGLDVALEFLGGEGEGGESEDESSGELHFDERKCYRYSGRNSLVGDVGVAVAQGWRVQWSQEHAKRMPV